MLSTRSAAAKLCRHFSLAAAGLFLMPFAPARAQQLVAAPSFPAELASAEMPPALWSSSTVPQQAAPGTAPMQQKPASAAKSQQPVQAAPGTAPMHTADRAKALAPGGGPKYDERWQIFGGLLYMNGQAGQNLAKRYNLGGGEAQATYWLGHRGSLIGNHLGATADVRFAAGTTPVISPYYNRVVAMNTMYTAGATWKGPKGRYAALQYHALAGATSGIFDYATNHYPGGSPVAACAADRTAAQGGDLGLYCNHTSYFGTYGASVDFNYLPKVAIRLSPDFIQEHYGTELRNFFSIGGGVVFRLGHH